MYNDGSGWEKTQRKTYRRKVTITYYTDGTKDRKDTGYFIVRVWKWDSEGKLISDVDYDDSKNLELVSVSLCR